MNSAASISQGSCIKHQHHIAKIGSKVMQEFSLKIHKTFKNASRNT